MNASEFFGKNHFRCLKLCCRNCKYIREQEKDHIIKRYWYCGHPDIEYEDKQYSWIYPHPVCEYNICDKFEIANLDF